MTTWGPIALAVLLGAVAACSTHVEEADRPDAPPPPLAPAPAETATPPSRETEPPSPDGPPFQVGGDVEGPRFEGSRHIEGLSEMFASGEYAWGACIFRVVLDETGEVGEIDFLKPEDLAQEVREAIVAAVREWEFSPATRAGEPVAVHYNLVIHHCPYRKVR